MAGKVNPYDFRVRDWGLYVEGRLPVVLGNDIAGVVEETGPGVSSFQKGDRVFGQTNYLKATSDQCGLQEYALLDAYTVARVPGKLSDDDGASLVCNVVAPFWAVFGKDGLGLQFPFPGQSVSALDYASQKIVIIGAGSNCGKYAVQSCALAGFGTIVATANKSKNDDILRAYGATHVVDRHAADVKEQIRSIVGNDLVYAVDAVNTDHSLGVSILSDTKKGTLACLVPPMTKIDENVIGDKKAGYEDKFIQGQSHNQPELGAAFWKNLPGWMEEGKIRASPWEIIDGLDVEKINSVLDLYSSGGVPEKQVHVHI